MYSDELSDYLRIRAQPLTKFRQLCDAQDGAEKGLNRGDQFRWDVYTNVGTQGQRLDERSPMPETGFTIVQHSLTVLEAGNSVPFTGKLEDLAKHNLQAIIDKTLKDDARKYFDIEAFYQFRATPLRVTPTGGNSTTSITVNTNSTAPAENDVQLETGHIKAISDYMKEANIPPYLGDDYFAISHPSTFRTFKNELEQLKQYTTTGIAHIFSGEIGRYENTRFIEQNFIPKGGANSSTVFNAWTGTPDPWANGLSSWMFMFGGDTVTEAMVIPEEIRARIPGDFGRSKGMAWYYLGGFGLVHSDTTDPRVVFWDSTS
jgi:N4-gp56 family major capsid protein